MAEGADHKPAAGFIIRPMVYADLPQIVQMEKDIFPDPWSSQSFAESLKEEKVGSWVAESRNRIIAYMITLWVADEIHIINLAVHHEHRQKGVATQLLATLENLAQKHGSSHFWLEVRSSNQVAQIFYATHGFKPLGFRKNYYRNGEDALIMAKTIGDITE